MGDSMEGARSVLEGMKKQREELDAAIAVIEKWIASQSRVGSTAIASTGQIGTDEFFRLSTTEAIKKLLKIVGKPARSTQDIIDGLKRGGSNTASYTNVYTSLGRLQKKKEVVKVGDNWGLEEWYPPAPSKLKVLIGNSQEAEAVTVEEKEPEIITEHEKVEVLQTKSDSTKGDGRKKEVEDFIRAHGPSTRSEILSGTDVPGGTIAYCLRDATRFVRGEDGKWRTVE